MIFPKIDTMRRAAKLSPAQFLDAIGIQTSNPSNYYSMLKQGRKKLSSEKIEIAAQVCGCSIEFIPIIITPCTNT